MKTNWQTRKLGEICEISTGKSNANEAIENGEYAFFDRSKIIKKSSRFLFNCKALIIPGEGAEFFPRYYSGKFDLHQRAYALFNFDKSIDIRFIEYFLIFDHKYFERVAVGATAKSLRLRHFQDLEISLPPLPEQHRIVKILDEVFENIEKAKENAQKNLQNSKELFESYLQNIFDGSNNGWKQKTLGEICDFFNGFAFKSKDSVKMSNTQLIRMGNLYQNHLDLDRRAVYYPDVFADNYQKYLLREDDLIISLTGTTGKEDYGYTVRIPKTNKKLLLNQRIAKIVILDESETVKDYLLHFLLSRYFLNKLYKTAHGTRQANLSTDTMKKISLKIPMAKEQKSIVAKLDALSAETKKMEAIYRQKLADLEELKKSVLKKAFNGEL